MVKVAIVVKVVKVAMVANSGGPPCSRRCFPTVIRILSCSCLGAEERRRERQGPTPPCTTLVYLPARDLSMLTKLLAAPGILLNKKN